MKKTSRFLALFLPLLILAAAACGLVLWLAGDRQDHQREMLSSMGYLGNTSGFVVTTGTGGDFPTGSQADEETLKTQLDSILSFAEEARISTLFFQVRADGAAFYKSKEYDLHPSIAGAGSRFDPLDYLCAQGLEKRIQVCALAEFPDPSDPDFGEKLASSTAELGEKYPLGGILLTGGKGQEETLASALRDTRARLNKKSPGVLFGLLVEDDAPALSPMQVESLTRDGTLSLVALRGEAPVSAPAGEEDWGDLLARWTDVVVSPARLLYVSDALPGEAAVPDSDLRLLLASMEESVSGTVLSHYGSLKADPERTGELVSLLSTPKGAAPELFFPIPKQLTVAYPAGDVSVTDSAIFLMGTSDPEQPLTIDGEEVERFTSGGTWGSLQKLEQGKNTFTLRQGEKTAAVTVTRYTPGGPSPIEGLQESSLFPRYSCGVDSDGEITLSCMGPAGAVVSATLNGRTIQLAQSGNGQNGVPVAFRGTMTLSPGDFDPNATASIGSVTYLLRYGGKDTTYQSQGEVFVAGQNVPLAIENTAQLSAVLSDPDDDESIFATLKPGARAVVEKTVRTSRSGVVTLAYKLQGSGYILAGTPTLGPMVTVLEGAGQQPVGMEVGTIASTLGEDGSLTITLGEGTPAILTQRTGDSLILDCLGTTVTGDTAQFTSSFIHAAVVKEAESGVQLTLRLEPNSLWGYDLYYQDGKTYLYLKPPPKRSETLGKPLSGVTVMLDPGHGGSDPGALGAAGGLGPAEAQLNLAVSQAVKYRLEQLGAKVSLCRGDDSQVSLFERVDASTAARPDIFLSIHHNSGVLTGNMNRARRMECYYFEDASLPFAQSLMEHLGQVLPRPVTDPEQARYYVTRQTGNPAVLLEVGFMVNPLEYEECADLGTILRTAWGISDAILAMVE